MESATTNGQSIDVIKQQKQLLLLVVISRSRSLALLYFQLPTAQFRSWLFILLHLLQVMKNDFQGVYGGYTVNVLWVLNGQSAQWEQQLPQQTQRWLSRQRQSGAYKNYPNIYNNLEAPAPLISLLSQQASWGFRATKDLVLDWIADVAGSQSGPSGATAAPKGDSSSSSSIGAKLG
jgi:hypothetical protein